MVDRQARDRMITAIQSYMDERITAFAFDDALREIDTSDATVNDIRRELWYFYDDVTDHKIVASKEEWDYFNRLLLLLHSDGELDISKSKRHWSLRQGVAVMCLFLFSAIAVNTGIGEHLLAFSIPFGLVSMLLAFLGNREARKRERIESAITPFPSIASLLTVRRSVPAFIRRRYPHAIQRRNVRDLLSTWSLLLSCWIAWLLFAPIPLLFQILPERVAETRIILLS